MAQLATVPLTKEDVISVYNVPVDKEPTTKMEWTFPHAKYVRYLVEERASKDLPWKIREGYAYNSAVKMALFLFQIADRHAGSGGENLWQINTRLGGSTTHLGMTWSGWAGSTHMIPVADNDYVTEERPGDPDKIFLLTTGKKQYRIRLESSDDPFPGKQPWGNDKP